MREGDITNEIKDFSSFSVAMSVYKNDCAEWFDLALESVTMKQTVTPNEIVLVVDGPVSGRIQDIIDKYVDICTEIDFVVIYLNENRGLGNALRIAVEKCKFDLVARMDSDDIAVSNRFEQQLSFFQKYPELDMIGGDIVEFVDNLSNKVGKREVPCDDKQIKQYIKRRCPFNHMTVMYKKKSVMLAGNYKDWFWNEDYYLWLRMYLCDAYFMNTGTVLVNARVGREMYQRRGGMKYFKSEIKLQKYMVNNKIVSVPVYISNCIKRLVVQVIMPTKLRGWFFQRFARKKV